MLWQEPLLPLQKNLLNKKSSPHCTHGMNQMLCLLMLDLIKKKYIYIQAIPPSSLQKIKEAITIKKALFICISSSKSTLSPLFIHSGFNSISPLFCLLAFSIVKKLWKKVQFEPVKILFFSLDVKLISSGFENKLDSISHAQKSGSGVMHTALT